MPTTLPKRGQTTRVRRVRRVHRTPCLRRNVGRGVTRRIERPLHVSFTSLSSSSKSDSSSSIRKSDSSSRSHSDRHKQELHEHHVLRILRRNSKSVMPLYGTNGNEVIGYVQLCRNGLKLWYD